MEFTERLTPARLERRYKRFLADVVMASGKRLTCHCPNTGSMLGCADPGSRVWLSRADNPRRKYAWTWEQVETASGVRVGIHTGRTNRLVREALQEIALLPELGGYADTRAEFRVADADMRADFLLSGHAVQPPAVVEVKNVTAAVDGSGVALFPDATSSRASRHLEVLMEVVRRGQRGVLVFCAQRADAREVRPADDIDPRYGRTLRAALAAGVEVLAIGATVREDAITPDRRLPVVCP